MENQAAKSSLCVLALLFFIPANQGLCPSLCSCSGNDRNVDCSGRNLTILPLGLQDNVTCLNLSGNHFVDLNHQLTQFANLRTLDVSDNWLQSLPAQLPKSLWEIYAANNKIKVLQKLDTAYQWNLKVLDVSRNMVEKVVLINNTMSSLRFLNLSSNKLWTVPTNIPLNTEVVDLSNNFLTQILPGSLMRLAHLSKLYLHNNKFAYIPNEALDQLVQLQLITLDNNPWLCGDTQGNLSYLQTWITGTEAIVVGVPCSEEATEPWKTSMPYSAAPTATENQHFVKAMKAAPTTELTNVADEQPPSRMKDLGLNTTADQPTVFTSTGGPLILYPGDLSTERLSSLEAAAATHTIHIQETDSMNSSTKGLAKPPMTPMTLSITSGVPTNYPKRPQSTTVKRERTTKTKPRVPSKASRHKGHLFSVLMLAVVVLATGNGSVL